MEMEDDEPARPTLAPALLVAMPQLADPNFRRTVILLCEYSQDGAWGFILNRPTGRLATGVIEFSPPLASDSGLELWTGGPVEPQRGALLLPEEPLGEDAYEVSPGVYVSSSASLLRTLVEGPHVEKARLLMGYAGWGAGQLDRELAESSWLISDVPTELVFDTKPAEMWEAAIRRLGVDPAALQASSGIH
ncbi:MAG TPA: YqgE/AlgH family protein [Vicinamibacterales bacterium]|nr:YqgE/AlgH family protein [Vicinamibacterales bacterium]